MNEELYPDKKFLDEREKLKILFSKETDFKKKQKYEEKIKQLENERTKSQKNFDFKIHFSEVFHKKQGFDVVIANPPYVKEYTDKSAFDGLRKSSYYKGKMDLWYFFACKSIDISRENSGIVTFIAQNNWVTSFGASEMRKKVIVDSQILNLIDFGDFKIFDAGIQTMIMIFQKNISLEKYNFDYRRLSGKILNLKMWLLFLQEKKIQI